MNDDNNEFTPEELVNLKESTKEVIVNLTAREAKVLRSRFGIDLSKDIDPDNANRQFEVTRKRIQEIEAKALRKLKDKKEQIQKCSFCGKSINAVKKMIKSEINNVCICNECIKNCGNLLSD